MRRTVSVLASVALAALMAGGPAVAQTSDTTPPDTGLSGPDAVWRVATAHFTFSSNEAHSTFECKLDAGAFRSCRSPKVFTQISEGPHNFQVRATDPSGNVDPTPAELDWTVNLRPEVTFTEEPDRVTNDRTPTWAWTVEDTDYVPGSGDFCKLYEAGWDVIFSSPSCSSPLTYGAGLPDGDYGFWVEARDQSGGAGLSDTIDFEVDNVAPLVVSGRPTGTRVGRGTEVAVLFDDRVYGSSRFVNIYEGNSGTPLAVKRYDTGPGLGRIRIVPEKPLKSGTRYTVRVTTGGNDGANNLESPYAWNFKTKR